MRETVRKGRKTHGNVNESERRRDGRPEGLHRGSDARGSDASDPL